jgi:putative intracellular protease/amidase
MAAEIGGYTGRVPWYGVRAGIQYLVVWNIDIIEDDRSPNQLDILPMRAIYDDALGHHVSQHLGHVLRQFYEGRQHIFALCGVPSR